MIKIIRSDYLSEVADLLYLAYDLGAATIFPKISIVAMMVGKKGKKVNKR